MKRLIVLLVSILFGCKVEVNTNDEINLMGKTLIYAYGTDVYHLTFDSDSELHWVAMQGDEKGVVYEETYISEWIEDSYLFISWEEDNGIAVSQILDFENGKVHNHLLKNREGSSGIGKISFLETNSK